MDGFLSFSMWTFHLIIIICHDYYQHNDNNGHNFLHPTHFEQTFPDTQSLVVSQAPPRFTLIEDWRSFIFIDLTNNQSWPWAIRSRPGQSENHIFAKAGFRFRQAHHQSDHREKTNGLKFMVRSKKYWRRLDLSQVCTLWPPFYSILRNFNFVNRYFVNSWYGQKWF